MDETRYSEQIVLTNKARCRDCYRCVRACPVKAISMHGGQAQVIKERCLACGTCIRECPQHAKTYRHEVDRVLRLFKANERVAVSVAPSFAAILPEWKRKRLPSALRRLGFWHIEELATAAWLIGAETAKIAQSAPEEPHIASACPSIVRYVEIYRPELLPRLVPVASPMVAHARVIKEIFGQRTKFVFIGPCVAKKLEAEAEQNEGLVDAVLTFEELFAWLEDSNINLAECEESDFDGKSCGSSGTCPANLDKCADASLCQIGAASLGSGDGCEGRRQSARAFALEGGLIKTAQSSGRLEIPTFTASGFSAVQEACDFVEHEDDAMGLLEPMFCAKGCINGPGIMTQDTWYAREQRVRQHEVSSKASLGAFACVSLRTSFSAKPVPSHHQIGESEIRRVLESSGKAREEDQLNCGACGYDSCREKAVAVILGLAEIEMCLPRMKRLAIQRSDRIIETSPNGILILDEHLSILHMNPAFRKLFRCSKAILGKPVSYLMDPKPFELLVAGEEAHIRMTVEHPDFNLVCHQLLYSLPEERQYIGIFVNTTKDRAQQRELDTLREKTVLQAKALLDHQLNMAEEIARCLGENTARSQDLLERLVNLAQNSDLTGAFDDDNE